MEKHNYEGKNYEELMLKIKSDLNAELEDLYIKVESTDATLFKAKKYKIEVVKKSDIVAYIKEYLGTICSLMNVEFNLEVIVNKESISIQIVSDNNQVLIGKDGKILNAIQMLLRHSLTGYVPRDVLITLDISNYKGNKLKRIEKEVKKIARDVLNTKIDVSLDPMNSYERRYIHTLINGYEKLTTESVGEGVDRHIVIKYVEK